MASIAELYKKSYKVLPIVPLLLFLPALLYLPNVRMGIDFTGGIILSFSAPPGIEDAIKESLSRYTPHLSVIPVSDGYIVEMIYPEDIKQMLESLKRWRETGSEEELRVISSIIGEDVNAENVEEKVSLFLEDFKSELRKAVEGLGGKEIVIETVVPVLGQEFWDAMRNVFIAAVVLLLLAIMAFFRNPLPVLIMVVSTLYDALVILGFMGLVGIPLTMFTLTVLLMMIGYSIDTDVVASNHLVRKRGERFQSAERAFKTGITMSLTTLIAMLFVLGVGILTRNVTAMWVGMVLVAGVIADMIITWTFNVPVLLRLGEKHG